MDQRHNTIVVRMNLICPQRLGTPTLQPDQIKMIGGTSARCLFGSRRCAINVHP